MVIGVGFPFLGHIANFGANQPPAEGPMMKSSRLPLTSAIAVALVGAAFSLTAPPTVAAQRTFVHSPPLGNDANTAFNCSLAAP